MSNKQSVVVICPGRGTYNASELGYLERACAGKEELQTFVAQIDTARVTGKQIPISELDGAERYSARLHANAENASTLIYACALADFKLIDTSKYEIVAVTGNSMGWYLALACTGILADNAGFEVVNSMGTLMHKHGTGGQIIYPLVNEQWQIDTRLAQTLQSVVAKVNNRTDCAVYTSIRLGGMQVLAGNEAGLSALLEALPTEQGRYPFRLQQHAGFHSPLLKHITELAQRILPKDMFTKSQLPLIDGRGHIWQPGALEDDALYSYTFDHQITQTYDFSRCIEVAIKEFAPDKLIILGPGTTLGAPVAQTLIQHHWLGLQSKDAFIELQQAEPFVLSMGIDTQRAHVVQP